MSRKKHAALLVTAVTSIVIVSAVAVTAAVYRAENPLVQALQAAFAIVAFACLAGLSGRVDGMIRLAIVMAMGFVTLGIAIIAMSGSALRTAGLPLVSIGYYLAFIAVTSACAAAITSSPHRNRSDGL